MKVVHWIAELRRKIRAAKLFVKVNEALSLRRYGEALELVRQVYDLWDVAPPDDRVPALVNLLYAELIQDTGSDADAYEACVTVIRQINGRQSKRKAPANRNYLLYRCKAILAAVTNNVNSAAFHEAMAIPVTYASLDLERTDRLYRELFPSTPEWGASFDAWFTEKVALARQANDT